MAIGGAMTTAYSLRPGLPLGAVLVDKTTYPSDKCTPPIAAVSLLRNWTANSPAIIVQGSDMAEFWRLWEGAQ